MSGPQFSFSPSENPDTTPGYLRDLKQSREEWYRDLTEGMFGTRPKEGEKARAMDRMELRPGYRRAEAFIKLGGAKMLDDIYHLLAEQMRGEERVRVQAWAKLHSLKDQMPRFLKTLGKAFRTESGTEAAEERDVAIMQGFFFQLENIDNTEELIEMICDDQAYIKMLAELSGNPEGEAVLSPLGNESKDTFEPDIFTHDMLDVDQPDVGRMRKHYQNLALFVRSIFRPDSKKSEKRKGVEATMVGAIFKKMDERQKKQFVNIMMQEDTRDNWAGREAGSVLLSKFFMEMVKGGVMTSPEVLRIVTDKDLQSRINQQIVIPDYDQVLKDAAEYHTEVERILAKNVTAMSTRFEGNIAARTLTRKKILLGVGGIVAGGLTALVNIAVNVLKPMEGKKGFDRVEAAFQGLFNASTSPHVLGGLAVAGLGTDFVTNGLLREEILYGDDKETKLMRGKKLIEQEVRQIENTYPGLSAYFVRSGDAKEDRYSELLREAKKNEALSGKFGLSAKDVPDLTDRELGFFGSVPVEEEDKKLAQERAKEAIAKSVTLLGGPLELQFPGVKEFFERKEAQPNQA